jgi:DNA-binding winged helix-turn-helix (wHTH) protein/TolB-like protein
MFMKSSEPRYRFGPFLLSPSEHTLLRDGHAVRLTRKTFELLVAFVEQPGHLLRKDELQRRLWPDAIVEEGNLNKHVSMLRKALQDREEAQKFIETVPRVGFRFVADVERLDSAPSPVSHTRSRALWVAALCLIALSGATLALRMSQPRDSDDRSQWKAFAVLPFTTLGGAESEWLGLGLADGVITRLSGQRLLPVRPTSSVRHLAGAGTRPDLASLGKSLDVDVILEGQVQREGELLRVTVQLTDVRAGSSIWADRFDQPAASVLELEDAIADRVATALRLQFAAAQQSRVRRRYTDNVAAYQAFTMGRGELARQTPDGTRRAVAEFERALAMDPSFALARSGLALASADMHLRFASGGEAAEWGERAEREAIRSLELDADLAEAHLARAAVLRKREFDWDETIAASHRALVLNPNLDQAHYFTAAAFYHLGLMDQAIGAVERGRRTGGVDLVEPARIEGLIALFSGDFAAAKSHLEEVSRRSSREIGDTYLALVHYYLGDVARARRMLEQLASEPSPATAARSRAALAAVAAASGDRDTARGLVDAVRGGKYVDHHVAYSIGTALAQLGDPEEAVAWLHKSADTGFPCAVWYSRDPLLDPLRVRPAFVALMAALDQRRAEAARAHAAGAPFGREGTARAPTSALRATADKSRSQEGTAR